MPETNNATLTCFTMEWQHKYQEDLYFTEVFGFCTTAGKDNSFNCAFTIELWTTKTHKEGLQGSCVLN